MAKPLRKNNLPGLHVEVVLVAAPDAVERMRRAMDIILAAARRGQRNDAQAGENNNLSGDEGNPSNSEGQGL